MSDSRAILRISALGSMQVHRGPVPVDLGPAKQRAVLASLALHVGHAVSIDCMLGMVWGPAQPVSARQLVHTYVARLRRLLEPDLPPRGRTNIISSGPGGYRLVTSRELVDVTRFELLYRQAKQFLCADEPQRAFELLGEAMRLWRDPELAELSALLNSPEILDLLRRRWSEAALDYVRAGLDLKQAVAVLPAARRLAITEPMNEVAQALYIVALEQTGRRAAAVRHFDDIRVMLKAELGVQPGSQLSDAYRAVLAGDDMAHGRPGGPGPSAEQVRPPWHGRGPGLGPLIYRERDLDAVMSLLAEQRLLTVTGPPGCGKSMLALRAAACLRDNLLGGVAVLDCAELTTPAQLDAHLSELLGAEPGTPPSRLLGDQQMLIVLDDVEHVIDACVEVVDEVVRACPNVSVVVTSREPLGVPYETVWRLRPLAVTVGDEARWGAEPPAVQLFARRAAQVSPGLRLGADDLRTVADLCARLDDLPLAVELAAECLATETLDELVRRLDDPLRELKPPRRGQPVHHRSLQAALLRSLHCLDGQERWCFLRLGALPLSFRAEQAEAVWAASPYGPVDGRWMLMRLAEKSLLFVRHDLAGPLYGKLRLVHRLAADLGVTERRPVDASAVPIL
ncbi:AfsR/SARP family transcriptional regulator [Couchioplanes caeruleus]|uniref:SARP transcriptional regulator n=2 Tax=Couchioplanes caeruleus TaxID=56438 RepID=A0A1K0GUN9_9ACTN|nr:BTAD domain-containing putative transcriptional regulator [Couchioplanes caeruleus]OJF16230.1 SARP transcriptional regulator [Couchioplanes caeruleus subsp. caeruleus]ROP28782.1 transcriptional regulator [Couchioplanes caeruleus]